MKICWAFLTIMASLLAAPQSIAQNRSAVRSVAIPFPDTLAFLKRETRRVPIERPLAETPSGSLLRDGIVGSLPVARNIDLRIGLLKVLRGKSREPALSRSHPMRDLAGRHERVAAAGLNFNF
ncbi:hypothetical protein [Sphingosinicella rhizophila]|uniref:Uncharacterized protein n=1 Tax=Sphingosinicella rhizophila TaxID=3050082 RepID=A0ABU3QA05_9SPHN|nr:hypothetical protein [Sphingosinicella sp. GR2756]MDT9600147.1 hypothetical protein [Sphingosinicella sp. GR2756]